ncbi:hypothetical protein BYT27DRAFT_7121457, partial [Phlegmacium glaucopus]
CSRQFTDAYKRGLTRKEAAWANNKYSGRRCMPTGGGLVVMYLVVFVLIGVST